MHITYETKRALDVFVKAITIICIIAALLVAIGCTADKTTVRPDYAAHLKLVEKQNQEADQRIAALADTSDCNGDTTCIVAAKGFAALAGATQARAQPAPPPVPRTFGDRLESIVKTGISALPGLGGIWANDRANERAMQRDQSEFEFWRGLSQDLTGAATAIATSGPSINVGGNWGDTDNSVSGDTVTDSYNQDNDQDNDLTQNGDGSAVGDRNELVNGNGNFNSGNIGNENRQDSDGDFDNDDNSNDGDDCSEGSDCSGGGP